MPLNLTRSFLSVILPGAVATAPWLLYGAIILAPLRESYSQFGFLYNATAFGIAVVVGAIFEGFGSYIEKLWDRRIGREARPSAAGENWVDADWIAYLASNPAGGEPVAYRYFSRKVTTLYFELGMMMAVPVCLVGVGVIASELGYQCAIVTSVLGAFMAVMIFGWFARDTHEVLCHTRARVNDAMSSRLG